MTRTHVPFATPVLMGVLASVLGAGCMQDRPPVFADAQWQLDCDSMMGMCSPSLGRSVLGENGVDGTIQCNVVETADFRTLSFYVRATRDGTPFEARLSNARTPRGGGRPAAGCSFSVGEDANRFTGACGSSPPSTEQPCQVEIMYGVDTMLNSPTVDIDVLCDHLPNASTSEQLRSVHFPAARTMPAAFRFYDCIGLSRE